MDLQTRKLNLITYLAQLQDEHFFDKIKDYILSKLEKDRFDLTPFCVETLITRIEQSAEDLKPRKIWKVNLLIGRI
ncbi:hypothetical protein QE422_003167 [Chryseobacterium sp. SORGH_AS 447]|uniref:hypothetical protein n=1 Tax=Chryseobacterium sp. SORGH_AS_0447 TaxID=3041769 RepID=UPI0027810452|nr:hypothetical protein [Chryseobacterium sp. SORGH_AS_0447]MDQ1162799.1 hypothetical protein [Chryseobacterium sp. SORGH_AS_0447]